MSAVNAVILCLINVWPGWQSMSFLEDSAEQVVGLVSALLVASVVVNLVYLAYDSLWLRGLGSLTTTGIGLAVLMRIWVVGPPFYLAWWWLLHLALFGGILGSVVALMVHMFTVFRGLIWDPFVD